MVPALRNNRSWRATVTPLASIIGSGFLVIAPVLGHPLGVYAFLGMLLITLVAIEVGEVLRFNIRHAEPLMARGMLSPVAEWTERAADLSLSLAYVISVAFYLRLMSAFALRGPGLAYAPLSRSADQRDSCWHRGGGLALGAARTGESGGVFDIDQTFGDCSTAVGDRRA